MHEDNINPARSSLFVMAGGQVPHFWSQKWTVHTAVYPDSTMLYPLRTNVSHHPVRRRISPR
eukprot:scaffold1008_cov124-Cylindrotheca_fusiformis.AAC.10